MERTELWLIRHAESTGNRDGILQGQADLPLSALGQRQARALADRLLKAHRRTPFSALISSDLMRARETAETIGLALNLRQDRDPRLREIDIGAWSGLTPEQIAVAFPDEWEQWQGRSAQLRRGSGESYADAHARISPALTDIARGFPGQRVLVVSHGGILRAYLAGLMGPMALR
jgi:broad specificity phosphatase PhoE